MVFDLLNELLPLLAQAAHEHANQAFENPGWRRINIIIHKNETSSSECKVTLHDGTIHSLEPPTALADIESRFRSLPPDEVPDWHRVLFSTDHAGRCNLDFDSDQPIERTEAEKEKFWEEIDAERKSHFEQVFGPLPEDILKIGHMIGVWPGGGLFHFSAPNLNNLWALTTFGLTNPDMPASITAEQVNVEDESGTPSTSMKLVSKTNPLEPKFGESGLRL